MDASPDPCSADDERSAVEGPAIHFEFVGEGISPECVRSAVSQAFLDRLSQDVLANWKEPTRWGPAPNVLIDVLVSEAGALLKAASVNPVPAVETSCAMGATLAAFPLSGPVGACLAGREIRLMFLIPWYTDSPVREGSELDTTERVMSFDAEDLKKLGVEDVSDLSPESEWWEFWKRE